MGQRFSKRRRKRIAQLHIENAESVITVNEVGRPFPRYNSRSLKSIFPIKSKNVLQDLDEQEEIDESKIILLTLEQASTEVVE
jgi:hypothetical protein